MAQQHPETGADGLRLDKWLWAARFFKTRSLASQAIDGGHVRLNGHAVKAARPVRPGDLLEISAHGTSRTVLVRAINALRRPAAEAQHLYEETAESVERGLREQERRRLAPPPGSDLRGRPTKRDRRLIRAIRDRRA